MTLETLFVLASDAKREIDHIVRDKAQYPSVWHAYSACKQVLERTDLPTDDVRERLCSYIADQLHI